MKRDDVCQSEWMFASDKEICLCRYQEQDCSLYMRVWNEIFENSVIYLKEDVKEQEWNSVLFDTNKLHLKIIERKTERFIGDISLRNLSSEYPEIGIQILCEYRNKGIGKRALNLFIERLKKVESLQCALVRIYSDNLVSQNLFEHFGAVKIGEEGKSACDFMKKMMHDMGKKKFEEVIQRKYEETQRYIKCYKLEL